MEYFEIFDAWEPIAKARKPKGLKNWARLSHVAHKLEGKKSSDITFTTAYPGKEGQKKILGSIEGNLHFLLGYGNPAFHLASYHYQIIDPNLSDEEAEELYELRGHPARPELWRKAEMPEDEPEGDLELGMPHPSAVVAQEKARRETEGVRVVVGSGTYLGVPSEGLVYGEHNGHVYHWDMLRDSFMAAINPKLVEAMDAAEEPVEKAQNTYTALVPDMVMHRTDTADTFSEDVYPLVKSLFPKPGSVLPLDTHTGETVYGVVNKASISFFDRQGLPVAITAWDRSYQEIDLTKGGYTYASILYNFGTGCLGLSREDLESVDRVSEETYSTPWIVKGSPTPGFEDVDIDQLDVLEKSVSLVGDTYRLILRESDHE